MTKAPKWMSRVLLAASLFNVGLGALLIFSPSVAFSWMGLNGDFDPVFEQTLGLVVCALGLGYALAALSPLRQWGIVFLGWSLQTIAMVAFGIAELRGTLPPSAFWLVAAANLVWWPPFLMILKSVFIRHVSEEDVRDRPDPPQRALLRPMSQEGYTLYELSQIRPTLVVFLRHAGCTFCREAMAEVASLRSQIEEAGAGVAFVHMSSEPDAQGLFESYGLGDVPRFSDPDCRLYRSFELPRGTWSQLFGWKVWRRGFVAGLLKGHGVGSIEGDSFRMPGVFLLRHGRIVREFRHVSAADRPDYLALVGHPIEDSAMEEEDSLVLSGFGD